MKSATNKRPKKRNRLLELLAFIRRNTLAYSGMIIFVLFFIIAVLGLLLTSGSNPVFDPATVRLEDKLMPPLSRPSMDIPPEHIPPFGIYLFGTDDLGRDVFSRMLQGAWVSLTVGFVAVGISVIIGLILGGMAGYFGTYYLKLMEVLGGIVILGEFFYLLAKGISIYMLLLIVTVSLFLVILGTKRIKTQLSGHSPLKRLLLKDIISVDNLMMRIVDIMLCFPSFFLILTVVALLPASMYNIMIVIGLTSWMGTARFVRAEILALREQDFVTAARALGVRNWSIIFRHLVPNAIAPVLVSATIGIANAILTEAGLSFLGFGVPPPHATWGNIISDGKRFIFDAPWLTFIPGTAILIVVLAFNLFGEGLRDIINPRLRERY